VIALVYLQSQAAAKPEVSKTGTGLEALTRSRFAGNPDELAEQGVAGFCGVLDVLIRLSCRDL